MRRGRVIVLCPAALQIPVAATGIRRAAVRPSPDLLRPTPRSVQRRPCCRSMDGDGSIPHDFFSQAASSGGAVLPLDGDGWGLTPPRLRGGTGAGGRVPVAGGLGSLRIGLQNLGNSQNLDLNTDCAAAASYPNMGIYKQILHPGSASGHSIPAQRARSEGVSQRQGRPPRQGLHPVRAPDRRGKAVAMSGRVSAGSSHSGSGMDRQAAPPIVLDDVGEEEEDDSMQYHQSQALVNQGNEKARRSEERVQSVAKCQNLAIECGATEESVEYFVACDLFKKKHNRLCFQNMKTPEARLTWLKRWCKAKNMYEADGGS